MGFWIFQHTQKLNKQSQINKNKQKHEKETCYKPEAMTQEDCICHDAWNYNPNT